MGLNEAFHKEQLVSEGYTILPNILPAEECERLKEIFEASYAKLSPFYATNKPGSAHGLDSKKSEKIVYNVHNKDRHLLQYIDYPKTFPYAKFLLQRGSYQESEAVIYQNSAARTPLPGCGDQQLHIDSKVPGMEAALSVQVMYLLDDFREENGATRIVPGSHRISAFPENGKRYPNEIVVTAPKGSVLIFHAGLWHGSGANQTNADRWAMIITYARWFVKPSFDYSRNLPSAMYSLLSDQQKDLLGFRVNPPKDEFTRVSRRSEQFEPPTPYELPKA